MIKSKTKKFIIGILLCLCAAIFALPSIIVSQKVYAYNTGNMPTGNNAIGNIYMDNGKFNKDNLDQLAKKINGVESFDDLVTKAQTNVYTSADFGETVVNFGSYTFNGTTRELTWIPTYVSNSDEGTILTLWLANTENDNTATSSNQETSTFSDGTYSQNASKTWNGSTVYSDTYDSSYIRNYMLNGSNDYTKTWGTGNSIKPPEASTMTKFSQFTGSGALASYIVNPGAVSWQKTAAYMKNDPEWNGSDNSSNWLSDNLWLPSMYEIYDSTIAANSYSTNFTRDGGLWEVKDNKLFSNSIWSWLRSGYPSYRFAVYYMAYDGSNISYFAVNSVGAVRPALHLNLTKVKGNAVSVHTHDFGAWSVVTPATCTSTGIRERICTAGGCPIADNKEVETIPINPDAHIPGSPATCTTAQTCTECGTEIAAAKGHTYSSEWSKDETNHWHAATCEHSTEIKDSAVHDWNSGTVTTNPTCTQEGVKTFTCNTCGQTKTESVAKTDHNYSAAWSKNTTNHWHACEDCGAEQPGSTAAHSGGTANCQQKATCEVCGQTYGDYGGHVLEHHAAKAPTCTEIGWSAYDTCKLCDYTTYSELAKIQHTPGDWITDDNPTCTEAGTKHKECMVCGTTLQTETISATGHNYSDEWETDGSNHWHICANECGIKGANEAHTFKWEIDKAASFTETGLRHEECTVCHLKRNENTVIPLVTCLHENTTHHDKVPATCVATGTVEYKYCSDCQKNLDMSDVELTDLEIPIDPNNHAWGDWEVTKQPNCTEKGEEKRTCANCDHEETRDIAIDPNAHDLEHHEAKDPTCTEIGWNEYDECSRCDYTTYDEIPAKGHDFSITVSGTPPTCQEGGTATMKCSRCEQTQEQNSADPVDHVYTNYVSNGNATCTANGTKTAECDFGCGATDTIEDEGSATGHTPGEEATCTSAQTCEVCNTELAPALGHDWSTEWSKDETNHWHICSRCDELNENTSHTYEWVITKEATIEESGLMENLCTVCGNKDGEEEIAKLIDPNGEIDLPVDINVEFKVTQSSTGNNYSEIDKSLKLGYWAQLWYRNDDGTLGNEFTDTINCFLTLKIPTDIIEAIRGGEEINRDKIASGLKVYYIDGEGAPVEVENFAIAMRDDDSWQIKFNYNEKFRAEVVFAADLDEPVPEPETTGIPWWVWLIVGLVVVAIVGVVIVIIVVTKKKNDGNNGGDTEELKAQLAEQGEKIDELLGRDDGGFNTPVELDENGNVIFK